MSLTLQQETCMHSKSTYHLIFMFMIFMNNVNEKITLSQKQWFGHFNVNVIASFHWRDFFFGILVNEFVVIGIEDLDLNFKVVLDLGKASDVNFI